MQVDFLVTGAGGQLGGELKDVFDNLDYSYATLTRDELDITDAVSIQDALHKYNPSIVINAAAYTAVDKAESERELCFKVNTLGTHNLATQVAQIGARLVHISTDYVFDGSLNRPLNEDDETNPLNVYGETKLMSENAVKDALKSKDYVIIRTSSVHGKYGNNFVKTMIKLFEEKGEVSVVDDQIMSPTYANYLAKIVIMLASNKLKGEIVHVSNSGAISWYDFALKIKEYLAMCDKKFEKVKINPCKAIDFPRPAKRPKYSAFNLQKLEKILGKDAMMSWEEGLKYHLIDLGYMIE